MFSVCLFVCLFCTVSTVQLSKAGVGKLLGLRAAFTILRLSAGRKFQHRKLYLVSNIKFDYVMICLLII